MTVLDDGTLVFKICRHCNTSLWQADSDTEYIWIDAEDGELCAGTSRRHEPTPAPPAKPRCRVVDQITAWTDPDGNLLIHEGDLVLRDCRMELVDRIAYDPAKDIRVHVEFAGWNTIAMFDPTDPIAVRRHLIEEG